MTHIEAGTDAKFINMEYTNNDGAPCFHAENASAESVVALYFESFSAGCVCIRTSIYFRKNEIAHLLALCNDIACPNGTHAMA